jgi:glycosyltransferase involved in cell wall biosynthesis
MRILMIAPEPVLSPRGTPISVSNRCRALSALGHEVDLITYPIGDDFDVPGLRILRAPRIPGIRRVKIGPSAAKLPLDTAVFARAALQLLRRRYDVIHTHEEAGAFGWWAHRLARTPHLHDMHNDLAMVLTNYGMRERHPLVRFASWLEKRIVRSAEAVIVIFPELGTMVEKYAPGQRVQLIHNVPLDPPADPVLAAQLRHAWAVDGEPLVVYTGTLEPYQGIPLLIEGFARVSPAPDGRQPRLVIVGGRPSQVDEVRALAVAQGIEDRVTLCGLRPPEEIPACLAAADVLVSTRSSGSNTPLKLYAYLHSGRPIVATRISSHLQVLDDTTAVLVEPDSAAVAAGIDKLIADRELGARLGAAAATRGQREYSPRVFLERTAAAYAALGAPLPDSADLDRVEGRLARVA